MSVRSPGVGAKCFLAVLVAVLGTVTPSRGQQGALPRGQPIQFSSPRDDTSTNSLQPYSNRRQPIRGLESDLSQALHSFARSSGSLEGVAPSFPVAPVIIPRRSRDAKEKKDDWVFMNAESVLGTPSVEDVMKLPKSEEEKEKMKLTPMERYYLGMNKPTDSKDENGDNTKDGKKDGSRDDSRDQDKDSKNDPLADLRRVLRDDANGGMTLGVHGSAGDIFGLGTKISVQTTSEAIAERARFDSYKEVYGQTLALPASLMSLPDTGYTPAAAPAPVNWDALGTASKGAPQDYVSRLALPSLPGLQEATILGPQLPFSSYAPLQKIEQQRSAPPTPTFTIPRRAF